MQVSIESPSKLERRITVTVPMEQLDAAFDKRISQLAKTVKLKGGFRPGSPQALTHVKQLYGDSARKEALSEVIQSSLYAAIMQEKLNPVGMPQVEPKSIVPGKPLEFTATFEVLPEVEAVKFNTNSIEKEISTIAEPDIDKVLERLTEQYITWTEVQRAAQDKDQVVVDFRGSIDGKTFAGGEAHDYPIIIGSNTMIPGFEEGIKGMQAGEEKNLKVTFPSEYFAKEMAGKDAEFAITVRKVSAPEAPTMDAELIKKFGIKSGDVAELRAEIKKNLEREVERITKTKLKAKIFDLLLEQNAMEVPHALVEQEAKRIHDQMHPHHAGKEHNHSANEMAEFNEAAKRNVILGLLVGQLIKEHDIKADKNRIHDHIAKLAAAYENPAEVVKWYASDKRRQAEVEMLVLEEQVLEKLLESITVTEKMINYTDLMKS